MGNDTLKSHQYKSQKTEKQSKTGLAPALYLVATPIGNASDITLRALAVLDAADAIFCEDTRVTQKLLAMHGITGKKLIAAHDHNEDAAAPKIAARIKDGEAVAYASDAGLPLISDPGARIVKTLLDEGLSITSLPGANAALTALQLSGLPATSFYFAGFLPVKTNARRDALAALAAIPATLIFYEAPHRLKESLADMLAVFGARPAVYARELTKRFEDIQRGALDTLCARAEEAEKIRGECVILVGAAQPGDTIKAPQDKVDAMLRDALKTLSPRDAAFDVATKTGLKKRDVYQRILEMKT